MKRVIGSLLLLGAMSGIAYGQAPQSKPNFSGTWVFNPQKSALKMTAPSSLTLEITQGDPQLVFARTQVYGDQTFNWKLEIVPDGQKEVVETSTDYTTSSRARWEGNSLVLDQKITATDGTKVNDLVTYSLGPDGNTLLALEQQTIVGAKRGTTSNKWVYEKKSQ